MSNLDGSTGGGNPYGGWQPASQNETQLKAQKARKTRRALLLLIAIAAVAFAAGWNPPTGTVHSFTKASDYNSERESGCTNSGKGCHGSESRYASFNDYHPDATCTSCHDYQGVGCIPCHSDSKNHECAACHDGTVPDVPDRVRLTDPYPRGHYRETTHTAMGTDMDAPVRVAEKGEAKAVCKDCHSRDLRLAHTEVTPAEDSEYGDSIGCGECHNDTGTKGQEQVLADWEKRDCESCHAEKTKAPMHSANVVAAVESTGTAGCGKTGVGCHDSNDIHGLHANAPTDCSGAAADGEPVCHTLKAEAVVPTSTACGGPGNDACHQGYTNDELSHAGDGEVHSPKTSGPANDTSYQSTGCGGCHRMDPDGTSLIAEHDLSTSEKSLDSDGCRNCHNAPESLDAIDNDWEARDTAESCSACHGLGELPAAHTTDFTAVHEPGQSSAGCANSGPGCHPAANLSEVGAPTTTANIHRDCLRCHDWRASDGNVAYDPTKKTCGQGRDCHGAKGDYDPKTSVHAGGTASVDGSETAHHEAGAGFKTASYTDSVTGNTTTCVTCHSPILGFEHSRPNNVMAGRGTNSCVACHNHRTATAETVKADWPGRTTAAACSACHGTSDIGAPHAQIDSEHQAVERAPDGTPTPGFCAKSGCHPTADVRIIHKDAGCANRRCHSATGDIAVTHRMSCGGGNRTLACHASVKPDNHADHSADLTGTVDGIRYVSGANIGCFGCHADDLRSEHSTALAGTSMEGNAQTSCRVCHEGEGQGAYASLPAVKDAIANGDRRCVACHKSGTHLDGGTGVASPHKAVSLETSHVAGTVWADPFEEWKAALDGVTGGGHNVLSADLVGGARDKQFPVTTFTVDSKTYRWALPVNSGRTTWLKASVFGTSSVDTTAAIQHLTITCEDCHEFPDGAAGPQGAAVQVRIDPAYSQTEYANPVFGINQFRATGTNRVICHKCHTIYEGAVEATRVAGNGLHNSHRSHGSDKTTARYYGEKCIDCHVRIPHAWKRPRLLIRTVVTTDGVQPDAYPYVRKGTNVGLLGVLLNDFPTPTSLTRASCVTGGCYRTEASSTVDSHPWPSKVPNAQYWP